MRKIEILKKSEKLHELIHMSSPLGVSMLAHSLFIDSIFFKLEMFQVRGNSRPPRSRNLYAPSHKASVTS